MTVLPPVRPQGEGWPAAVRLRDEVRDALLAATGEPDLHPADAPPAAGYSRLEGNPT